MRLFFGLLFPLVAAFFLSIAFIGCPPVGKLSSLRPSTATDLEDLVTAKLPSDQPDYIQNMGFPHRPWNKAWNERFSENFHGITDQGRLVFAAPGFHNLAYRIPDSSGQMVEYLVANGHSGHLQSYGWHDPRLWGRTRLKKDIAIRLDDHRYLLADDVPVEGFAVASAPWDGRESKYTIDQFTKLGQPHPTPGIKLRYGGPVTMD